MNSKIKLMGLALLMGGAIILSGCGDKAKQSSDVKKGMSTKVEKGKQIMEEEKGLMGGLKEAMQKGITMKCEGNDENGSFVTYTNGKNFRTEATSNGVQHIIVMKNGVSYMWQKGAKTGQKMDKKCIEDLQKDMGVDVDNMDEEDNNFDFSSEELESEEAEGKVKCSPSTKTDFSIPKDVKFVDQCELMKQQMSGVKEQMQKLQMQQK